MRPTNGVEPKLKNPFRLTATLWLRNFCLSAYATLSLRIIYIWNPAFRGRAETFEKLLVRGPKSSAKHRRIAPFRGLPLEHFKPMIYIDLPRESNRFAVHTSHPSFDMSCRITSAVPLTRNRASNNCGTNTVVGVLCNPSLIVPPAAIPDRLIPIFPKTLIEVRRCFFPCNVTNRCLLRRERSDGGHHRDSAFKSITT
jgi:hypothetical protein